VIIRAVSDAGKSGLETGKLEEMMNDGLLIMPRIKDMLCDNMIYIDGEKYKLTPKGSVMARIFSFYRNILKIAKGG